MIIDCLENRNIYYNVHPLMEKTFAFLEECVVAPKAAGRYEIDGDNLYALITEYAPTAKENPRYEAHDKYIDVQCMLVGSENQWYAPRKTLEEETPYNPVKDIVFFKFENNGSKINLEENGFAIYFPQDGHLPSMPDGQADKCVRAIVKIKI